MYKSGKEFLRKNPHLAGRINSCIENLVEEFKPERIILFGSFARGEGEKAGTMDFLIVSQTKLRFFDRIKKAILACSGGQPSVEPLVYTPEEFDLLLGQGEGFLEDAIEEGVVLYERK